MLNFSLYLDLLNHNEHENVICAKKSFVEKGYKQFLVENKTRAALGKKIISDRFFNFNFFHVFLVKLLNIILVDQKRNMHIFYKRKIQN